MRRTPRRVTAEALIALPEMLAPSVSPDGRWVAWTWLGRDAVACAYAAPTDGSAPPRRLTAGPDDAAVESWSADSRHVILALTDGGDEKVRLHIVPVEGGVAPRLLSDPAPDYFIIGGDLHPNGRWLVYAANTDDDGKAIEATRIHRQDIETGARLVLARPRGPAYARPRLNRPGTHVVYGRCDLHPGGQTLWLVDIEGKRDEEILALADLDRISASWSPDGGQLVVLHETIGPRARRAMAAERSPPALADRRCPEEHRERALAAGQRRHSRRRGDRCRSPLQPARSAHRPRAPLRRTAEAAGASGRRLGRRRRRPLDRAPRPCAPAGRARHLSGRRAAAADRHRIVVERHRAAPVRPGRAGDAALALGRRPGDPGLALSRRRAGARRRGRRPWRSRAARRRRVRPADPISGRPRLQRAGAELSRQHRLRHGLPGVDQGAGLGRPRAGGYSHRRAGPDRRRPGGTRPHRHHRPLLWRLQLLVRHHALSARGLRRRGAGLRHDRSRHRLRNDPPGPAPVMPRDDGRLAGASCRRSIASARRSTSSRTSRAASSSCRACAIPT